MKKLMIFMALISVFMMSACVDENSKEASEFIETVSGDDIKNEFTKDGANYGVFVSDYSEEYYQYKETDTYIIITIIGGRVDSYWTGDDGDDPMEVVASYYYLKEEDKLYRFNLQEGTHEEVFGYLKNNPLYIASFASIEEGYSSDLYPFNYQGPLLDHFLWDIKKVTSVGSEDVKTIEFYLSNKEFSE